MRPMITPAVIQVYYGAWSDRTKNVDYAVFTLEMILIFDATHDSTNVDHEPSWSRPGSVVLARAQRSHFPSWLIVRTASLEVVVVKGRRARRVLVCCWIKRYQIRSHGGLLLLIPEVHGYDLQPAVYGEYKEGH